MGIEITGQTRLLGIIGHPVSHSLSPRMHNAAFAADAAGEGADYAYVAMDVCPERFEEAVRGLRALGFIGFNVTMPYKRTIIPLLDEIDEVARTARAVNTVVIGDGGGLRGTNTDGSGFVEACDEAGVDLRGLRVLMVGAGGAAAAVAVAVLRRNPRSLWVANRTVDRARELCGMLRDLTSTGSGMEIEAMPLEFVPEMARSAEVIVNATYLGMKDEDPLPVPVDTLSADKAVCDVVYRSESQTSLVRRARDAGARVVSGKKMLLYQGVQAQRIWTGREPRSGVMGDALD